MVEKYYVKQNDQRTWYVLHTVVQVLQCRVREQSTEYLPRPPQRQFHLHKPNAGENMMKT